MYPIYSAWVLDATTLLPNAALKGQQVQVVTRNTTTPYPIFNAASDPIPSSLVTVTEAASTPTVYIDTESPETVYLDWYDAGTGQRGPIWFEEVSRQSAMASAASSATSATSAAASAASAAAASESVTELQSWIELGRTKTNRFTNPSFETDSTGITLGTEVSIARTTDAAGVASGTYGLEVTGSATPTSAFNTRLQQSVGAVQAGQWVAFAARVRKRSELATHVGLDVLWTGGTPTSSDDKWSAMSAASLKDPATRVVAVAQASAGTTAAVARMFFGTSLSGGVPGANWGAHTDDWITAVANTQAEALAAVAAYFDGSSPNARWTGTPNASTSEQIDMSTLTRAIKVAGGTILLPDASGTIDLSSVGGGGGTMDHNQLANLAVGDPHTQYLTPVRGDARYDTKAQSATNLAAAVASSSTADRARANHTGTQGMGTIEGLSAALASRPQVQVVVNGTEARPDGSDIVFWVGGASQPLNMGANDVWLAGAAVTPGDTTPPTAPGTPTASGVAATSLTLTWTAATDDTGVTGYRVRINGSTVLGPPPGSPTALSRLITSLAPSTEYTFEIGARDANANWGPYSPPSAPVTTEASSDTEDPSIPDNLVSSSITAAGFTVSWDASTDNVGVTGYRVLLNGVQYGPIVTDTSVVVTGRTAGTLYGVTVQATDAAGNWSDPSDELPVTTSAGGSLPTHSVFATPPAPLVKTVEASPYEHATGFYTYGAPATNGWKVKGARLYVPAGISVPTSCEVNLYVPAPGSAPVLGTPTKTATLSGITSGAWNSVNFPSVEPIDPAEFFWIGIKFADGTWLGISTFSDGFVTAADGSKLALSDRELGGGIVRNYRRIGTGSTVALTGGTERDVWFGMDAIVEEA